MCGTLPFHRRSILAVPLRVVHVGAMSVVTTRGRYRMTGRIREARNQCAVCQTANVDRPTSRIV